MLENQTETPMADVNEVTEVTPEQELDNAIKVATMHQVALNQLIQLGIRNYVAELMAANKSFNEKQAIAKSLERAILAGLDYGVDVSKPQLMQKGPLAKVENSFAAHIARAKENGMILTARNYEQEEQRKNDPNYVPPVVEEEVVEVKNKYNLSPEEIEQMESMDPKEKKQFLKTKGEANGDEKGN